MIELRDLAAKRGHAQDRRILACERKFPDMI